MAGYAGGYAISPFPVGPGVGTEATDKAVLYWDGSLNVIRGSADLLFDATLKTLTLGTGGQMLLPDGTTAAPALSFSSQSGLGIFKPGGNLLSIGLSGNERFRFDTSTVKLSIYGGAAALDFNTDTILSRAAAGVLSLSTGSAMYFPDGTVAAPSIAFANNTNMGIYRKIADHMSFVVQGSTLAVAAGADFRLHSNAYLSWSGGTPDVSAADLKLYRDAANTLALRNSTNAQTFNLYGTYTDASNYERMTLNYNGTYGFTISSVAAGSGTARSLYLNPASGLIYMKSVLPVSDAASAFGADGARWKSFRSGGVADVVPMAVILHASQTANAIEVRNSSGTALTSITKDGYLMVPDGTAAAPGIAFVSDTNTGISRGAEDQLQFNAQGGGVFKVGNPSGFGVFAALPATAQFGWTASVITDSLDTTLYRDAAGTLALRNGTNAQTFRIYNTYTDASNYERAMVSWSTASNLFVLGTEKAGTGSNRSLSLEPATGINYSKGHFYPKTDASWYLGLGALKWLATFTGGFTGGTLAKSANYTVDVGDHVILVNASAANRTITLPAAADNVGRIIHIKKTDSSANYVRIDGNSTELVEDATTQDLLLQGENLMLQCDGTQWWVI